MWRQLNLKILMWQRLNFKSNVWRHLNFKILVWWCLNIKIPVWWHPNDKNLPISPIKPKKDQQKLIPTANKKQIKLISTYHFHLSISHTMHRSSHLNQSSFRYLVHFIIMMIVFFSVVYFIHTLTLKIKIAPKRG